MCAFMACTETLCTAVCILHDLLQETKSVNYNISQYFNKYIVICDLPYVTKLGIRKNAPPQVSLLWHGGGACVVIRSRELCWR